MLVAYKGVLPRLHQGAFVENSAQVVGDVELGPDASVWFNAVVRGDIHHVRLGEATNIQDCCVLHVIGGTHPCIVEDHVTVGHGAIIHGAVVRSRCLIGMGAVVLDGADVGEGSVIAAGAVVAPNMKVPRGSLVMGVPAKVVRQVTAGEAERIEEGWRNYVALKADYTQGQTP